MKNKRLLQLEALLNEDPGDPFLHYALALEHIKNESYHDATIRLEYLLSEHPGYLAAYYQLGKLCENLGQTERASDVYKRGMSLAKEQKNMHTFNELNSALEELTG